MHLSNPLDAFCSLVQVAAKKLKMEQATRVMERTYLSTIIFHAKCWRPRTIGYVLPWTGLTLAGIAAVEQSGGATGGDKFQS